MNIRIFTFIALATTLFCGCKGFSNNGNNNFADSITVERDSVVSLSKNVEVRAYVDFPVGDSTVLSNSICELIWEKLDIKRKGSLFTDRKEILRKYVASETDGLAEIVEDAFSLPLFSTIKIFKYCETDIYLTYVTNVEAYSGAAHEFFSTDYTTILKSDGRRFGKDMLICTNTAEFSSLLADGIISYFHEMGEMDVNRSNLAGRLSYAGNIDHLPLPETAPALTKDGVMFVYQEYEIADFSAGMPSFVIPYDKMQPYLSILVKKLVR